MRYSAFFVVLSCAWLRADEIRVYYDYVERGTLAGGKLVLDSNNPVHRAVLGLDAADAAVLGGWPVTTIVDNGSTANRIDLVILGDGYTAPELGDYATHVANVVGGFFAQEPLAAYASYFNVHRVDVVSNESGVDEIDQGIFRDTALDMEYGCFNIERLLCINVAKAYDAAASAPQVEQILALANSTRYGGAGYPDNNLGTVAGNNVSAIEIGLHEFGHAFADLADEYDYADGATYTGPEPIEPNVSIYTAAVQVSQQRKWWLWMNLPNVDTFQGAYYNQFGVYRPTFNSKMRSLNRPFEQVNIEQFVISMYEIVSPIDDATPSSATPLSSCTTFFVAPLAPLDHALAVQWSIDGVNVSGATGTMFTVDDDGFVPGIHQVSVTVTDGTARVRNEAIRQALMTESRQWPINVLPRYGDVTQDGVVDLNDILCTLDGFGSFAVCADGDLSPCDGDGMIDLNDILAQLDAFSGQPACPDPCA